MTGPEVGARSFSRSGCGPRKPVGRAAADDPLAAQGGPPLLLDQDGFHGPGFGIEADLARGGVLFPAVARAGALRCLAAGGGAAFSSLASTCGRVPLYFKLFGLVGTDRIMYIDFFISLDDQKSIRKEMV
jgi:hypothetical protein